MKLSFFAFVKSPYSKIFIIVLILDYLSKIWAATTAVQLTIIDDFFYLAYSRNTGAAWSILEGQQWLLALISFTVGCLFFYYYLKQYQQQGTYQHLAISLFLSGTWGNFIDRAFYPEGVIDFLSFRFGNYVFPTFNLADSALTIGVILLMATSVLERKKV